MSAARRCLTALVLAILTALVAAGHPEASPSGTYGQLPLSFEANRGQTDASVGFLARGTGYQLFLSADEAVLVLRRPGAPLADALRMALIGSTARTAKGTDRLPGTVNYLTGRDPRGWRTSIPTFAKVLVPEVYPGVDLVYYGQGRQLEYDFILAPGADPAAIRLSIRGLAPRSGAAAAVDERGDLTLRAPAGDVILKRPVAYQLDAGGRRETVDVAYALAGPAEAAEDRAWTVGFALGAYDRSRPLVIDPVLSYSTYLGGSAEDAGMAIAVRGGEAYVTGYTDSLNFPPAGGSGNQPGQDAFVAKLNAAGTALVYATYLGGNGDDAGMSIAVDAAGQAYVTGDTNSTNFPTAPLGSALFGPQGGRDAFVAKLSADGAALVYSTHLGGDADDTGLGIALDGAGNAYVTGWTDSSDFPPTSSAFQGDQPGRDAFVVKLSAAGTSLAYATYLGGDGSDEGHAIAVDAAGNAYVTGGTTSTNLPTTGANPRTLAGAQDVFVAKLDPAATGAASRLFLTYLGGSGEDAGRGIAVDATGLVYVTGSTVSSNFPIRSTASQSVHGGGQDAFLTKLNPAGLGPNQQLMYSTFLGGSGDDAGYGVAVDEEGQAYVAGFTASADFPTRNAADAQLGGARDAFVAKFDALNVGFPSLRYATYLGGGGDDEAYGVALDAGSNAYVAGLTRSGDFPGAVGTVSGPEDAFVAKLSEPDLVVSALTAPTTAGSGDAIAVTAITRNDGLVDAGPSTTSFYLSTDNKLNPAIDTFLGSYSVPALGPGEQSPPMDPPMTLTLPSGLPPATYFLFAMADAPDVVGESLESNNKTKRDIVIGADLTVSTLSVSSMGATLTVTDTTRNAGGAAAIGTITKFFLASPSAEVPLGSRPIGPLAPGTPSGPVATDFTIPAGTPAGSYTVIARADADNAVLETSETNNGFSTPFEVGVDLVVATLGDVPSISGAGQSFQIRTTILNRGFIRSTASTTEFFLSTSAELDASAVSLGTRATPILEAGETSGTLAATVTIPAGTAAGSYFVIAKANSGPSPIAETRTTNNTRNRATVVGPDLVISFVSPAALTAAPGGTILIKDTARNLGGGDASISLTKFYLSTDALFDAADVELGQRPVKTLTLRESDFNSAGLSLTIPASTPTGSYFLIVRANAGAVPIGETNLTNNTATAVLTVAGSDLVVTALTVSVGSGSTLNVTDTTKNQGTSTAGASATKFFISVDDVFDEASDIALGTRAVPELAAGASSEATTVVSMPASLPPGTTLCSGGASAACYTIFARADAENAVAEGDESNNRRARLLDTRGSDLIISNLVFAWDATSRSVVNVSETTRNEGPATAGAVTTRLYLSTDAIWDPADTPLAPGRSVVSLAAGTHSTGTTPVTISPVTAPGDYFLIARADDDGVLGEIDETNNTRAVAIVIRPDLTFADFNVPATGGGGAAVTVDGKIVNDGPVPVGPSVLKIFLSEDAVHDAGDTLVATIPIEALASTRTSNFTAQVTLPPTGSPSIIAKIDPDNQIAEAKEDNNVRSKTIGVGADLLIEVLSGPSPSVAGAGSVIRLRDTHRNRVAPIDATLTRFFLSTDAEVSPDDVILGTRTVPALGVNRTHNGITDVTIPLGTAAGSYFVIALADAEQVLSEPNEANNKASFSIVIGPDLAVSAVVAASSGGGASITVTDTTVNQGGAEAAGSVTKYYLSTNITWDAADVFLGSRSVGPLAAGASSTSSPAEVPVPAGTAAGVYFVIGRADADGAVGEVSETNNTVASGQLLLGPDLTVALSVPSTTGPGAVIVVKDVVTNAGGAVAGQSVLKFILSPGNVLLGSRTVASVPSGGTNEGATSITVPVDASTGTFTIVAQVDADGQVAEVNETNNSASAPLRTAPDLRVENLTAPTEAGPDATILIKDTTKNLGAPSVATVIRFYLSVDAVLDAGDLVLGSRTVPPLPFGKADLGSTEVRLPATLASGTYHIIAKTDATELVAEALEDNNIRTRPISVGADLIVTAVTAPGESGAGKQIAVGASTKNQGAATGPSLTQFFLSSDETLSAGDRLLGSVAVTALGSNGSKTATTTVTLPSDVVARPEPYFIIAKANGDGAVGEVDLTNNTRARAIVLGADLVVPTLTVQTTGGAGLAFEISDSVRNDGAGDAPASVAGYYLSANGILDSASTLIGTRAVPPLAPGASDARTFSLTLPPSTPAGTYLVFAAANIGGLPEVNLGNNTRTRPTKIGPDLVISTLSAPGSAPAGGSVQVLATIANQGAGHTGTFAVRLYLSADAIFDPLVDIEVGSRTFTAGLAPGTSTGAAAIVASIPPGTSGAFTLIAVADPTNAVSELSDTNNQKTRALTVP